MAKQAPGPRPEKVGAVRSSPAPGPTRVQAPLGAPIPPRRVLSAPVLAGPVRGPQERQLAPVFGARRDRPFDPFPEIPRRFRVPLDRE